MNTQLHHYNYFDSHEFNKPQVKIEAANDDSTFKFRMGIPYFLQRIAAIAGLIAISPVLLFSAIAIRCESKGSVFFAQIRVGDHGKRFKMYKLRSMYLPSDSRFKAPEPGSSDRQGICNKFHRDTRITRVGRFIRKYSIDELPQLINVALGHMALVGPRPALPKETDQYPYEALQRLDCRPGLTGLWQVSGRADISFEEQVKMDIYYVNHRSIFMDIKLLFQTVGAVLTAKGAY